VNSRFSRKPVDIAFENATHAYCSCFGDEAIRPTRTRTLKELSLMPMAAKKKAKKKAPAKKKAKKAKKKK
jgi:hypothetical protein